MNDLDTLCREWGVAAEYVAETGERRDVPAETRRALLELLGAGDRLPERTAAPAGTGSSRCHLPGFLQKGRAWGLSCQLYGLRSRRNWGIGDFEDLATLAELVAAKGGDFLGVSPLHALFPGEPRHASPYSPSSRQFLNVLFIAPDVEPEYEDSHNERAARESLRQSRLVDYEAVAATKLPLLRRMHARFEQGAADARRGQFAEFCRTHGRALHDFAAFEVLAEHFGDADWRNWPPEFASPEHEAVQRFAASRRTQLGFHAWLQWLAERQLASAQSRALAAGQRIGLYLDLAVGVTGNGAAVWARPELLAERARIGSPPDAFNPQGQDWGLVPPRPQVLAAANFEPLREDLAANMRVAGAVRLDHVMALERLFWIPEGQTAANGGYVHYPFAEMAATVVEQSLHHRAMVIGEALGTVPEGFLQWLDERNIQSYRVLFFERLKDGGFKPPRDWPRRALACVSTHDLPTLQGWWLARDLRCRRQAGILSDAAYPAECAARDRERDRFWSTLNEQGLLSGPLPDRLARGHVEAIHRYLARSPARLMAVQLEDALGEPEQANLPGDAGTHPNWQRKSSVCIEDLAQDAMFSSVMIAMGDERPRP